MNSRQLVAHLNKLAPPRYAESWDNTGVSFGNLDREISKIMIALEPSEVVINQAVECGADVLITHHPMIFKPVGSLSYDSLIGRKITKLAQNNIVTFSMHTNMDIAVMSHKSADILGLVDTRILEVTGTEIIGGKEENIGFGSIGRVEECISLLECVQLVKEKFNIDNLRVIGDMNKSVESIAILPGSGKSFINNVIKEGVDVLVTGDIDYHSASDARDLGVHIIDAGHFETEYFFVEYMESYLKELLEKVGCEEISIQIAVEESPFTVV
ncbi:MAG: Nif3-like dinuclear metal center hexameric protein [Lachnospiraceae bacterium]|nr:Nif3-like dinuclear metal center hexameric protein [Lachnospiraceae bacterium]